MCVLYLMFLWMFFSSIKEINMLISKEMCVLLFDAFNGFSLVQLKK